MIYTRLYSLTAILLGLLLLGASCGKKASTSSVTNTSAGLAKACSVLKNDTAVDAGLLYDCTLNGKSYYFVDTRALDMGYAPYEILDRNGKEVALCNGGAPNATRKDPAICPTYPFVEHGATCTNITSQCE